MLIGVAGRGWYQEEGKPAVEILPGIGRKYDKSAAQVVLRWHLQHGVVAIPKSVH